VTFLWNRISREESPLVLLMAKPLKHKKNLWLINNLHKSFFLER